MRGRNAKCRSFASLTLPETGRATGRCSLREFTTAQKPDEISVVEATLNSVASAWFICRSVLVVVGHC